MSRLGGSSSFVVTDQLTDYDVLEQEIPWQTYVTAKLIGQAELDLLKRIDKQLPEYQDALLDESGPAFFEAFLTVLRATTKEQVVRYVLALLDQIISREPSRAALCHSSGDAKSEKTHGPYTILLRHLNRTDWFTQEKASRLLCVMLIERPDKENSPLTTGEKFVPPLEGDSFVETAETAVVQFVEWIMGQLRRPTSPTRSTPAAIHALAGLLRERGTRKLFHKEGGVTLLSPLLRAAAQGEVLDIQLLYETVLSVWLLSYLPECQKTIQDCGIARSLVGIVRLNVKEKVTRVALFTLKNILASGEVDVTPEVVDAKLPRLVQIRMLQNWGDEDILPTLEWMDEKIRTSIQVLSSFEKYRKEILEGRLDWSPMHTEEQFWKQNVEKCDQFSLAYIVMTRVCDLSVDSRRRSLKFCVCCCVCCRFRVK